jgi:hypothetical protein
MRNWLFEKTTILLFFCFFPLFCNAQSGYNIAIEMKNCNDTIAYLTFYQMDKTYIKDTCHKIKNGKIIFKGKENLKAESILWSTKAKPLPLIFCR